jgi:hypothetical protein
MRNRLIGHRDLRAEKARALQIQEIVRDLPDRKDEPKKGFAGSSRTIIGGNKSIGMSESRRRFNMFSDGRLRGR